MGVFSRLIDTVDFAARVYMRVRSRTFPHGIGETFFGSRMYCDTRDFIQRRVFHFGIYEPNLGYYILSRVQPGDRVLDVGANVGYITLLLSSIVGPAGHVVAIEASPQTYAQLMRNLALNEVANVTALNMAATSGACTVDIVSGEKNNSGTNSIRLLEGEPAATASVRGDALSAIPQVECAQIAFIKIDIEGSEAPVLHDILATLEKYPRLHSIAVELSEPSGYFVKLFRAHGFRAYGLPNNYRIGYTLVRSYLQASNEQDFVAKHEVQDYSTAYRDFVFERELGAAVPLASF